MITIVNYNMGNLGSIANMIKRAGGESQVTSYPEIIRSASKIILPGVGSFDRAIHNIKTLGLWDVLNEKAWEGKTPMMGICLGMQLMTKSSQEGKENGFGWISAKCSKFTPQPSEGLKVPHMGWNIVKNVKASVISDALPEPSKFYFVHSFYCECDNKDDVLFETTHGNTFVSGFQRNNLIGVQFHPEKSHKFGLQLIENFINYAAK